MIVVLEVDYVCSIAVHGNRSYMAIAFPAPARLSAETPLFGCSVILRSRRSRKWFMMLGVPTMTFRGVLLDAGEVPSVGCGGSYPRTSIR